MGRWCAVKVNINHPLADTMSVVEGMGTYSNTEHRELAFFWKGQWVTTPIPEFSRWHDGAPFESESCVYPWVPIESIESFLEIYQS